MEKAGPGNPRKHVRPMGERDTCGKFLHIRVIRGFLLRVWGYVLWQRERMRTKGSGRCGTGILPVGVGQAGGDARPTPTTGAGCPTAFRPERDVRRKEFSPSVSHFLGRFRMSGCEGGTHWLTYA